MILLMLYLLSSVSSAVIKTEECEQYQREIQPDLLQNYKGEFKCIEQDVRHRCEDMLDMDPHDTPHLGQLRNHTVWIRVCEAPGSSCLGCQDSSLPAPRQEAVCTQRFRQVQLPVLKDNYEEFEMDSFPVPDGCGCSLTRGGED